MTTPLHPPCRLRLFGTPRIDGPAGSADLPETAPAYVIAYLAAQARWVTREAMAAFLWPDLPDPRAQHNLRVALHRAGTLLGQWQIKSALVAERRRVRLDIASDLLAFREAAGTGDWSRACALIDAPLFEAVQCVAYPALAEWMAVERESVRRAWRKALVEANQAGGLDPAALERYMAHHPSDAEIATLLVTRLMTTGHAGQARDVLSAFRAAAGDELPIADLDAVARQIERAAEGAGSGDATWNGSGVIGRDDALRALDAAVATSRLVSLTGLPGVGKSGLAHAWLHRQSAAHAFVQIAERTTAAAALERIVSGLVASQRPSRQPMSGGDALRALAAARGIVVLDGVDEAPAEAGLIGLIADLQKHGGLSLLVTTRRPLGLDGELVQTVAGLSTSRAGEAPSPAAQLFLREARRLRFDIPAGIDAAAERIAAACGGLPLALRLGAGWSRWLSPEDIVREFERGVASEHGVDPSLRRLVRTTLQKLTEAQRHAFDALSIVPGRFDMTVAVDIAAAPVAVIEALSAVGLVEWREAAERPVAALHALVRTCGLERLRAAPVAFRAAAARYVAWLGRRLGRPRLVSGQPLFDAAAVAPLIDEVVQGWMLAIETGDTAAMTWLLGALVSWHEAKGEFRLGLERLAPALQALDDTMSAEAATLTGLQVARATLTYRAGDFEVAARLALEAHGLADRTGQAGLGRLALNTLGLSRWMQGRFPEAEAALERALASAVDDPASRRRLETNLALVESAQGRYAAAEARVRRALDLAITEGEWKSAATLLNNLANLLRHQDRLDDCEPLARESLRLCHQHELDSVRPFALIGLALLHAAKGQRGTAREYLDLLDGVDPATLESAVAAGAAQLRATLALDDGALDEAHAHIVRSLRICQAHDDGANRVEALALHARLLWDQGRPDEAVALWRTLRKTPSTHSGLREQIDAALRSRGLAAHADGADVDVDIALVVERLLAGAKEPGR